MVLYELVIALSYHACKEGLIWCKDGSFMHPSEFRNSGKVAYGYALSDNKVARLKRSTFTYKWSGSDYSSFYQRITSAESTIDGVSNSNALKDIDGYSSSNCPAIYQCLNYINAGRSPYIPAGEELEDLYYSIMHSKMKTDLIEAGLYEDCNYREATSSSWGWIWSSSQFPSNSSYHYARGVVCTGSMYGTDKINSLYVIPFFSF